MVSSAAVDLLRAAVVDNLRFHPRVTQQRLGEPTAARERLAMMLPRLVPFRGRAVHAAVALLDWDHRLPSRQLTLRVHLLYDADGMARFEKGLAARLDEIKRKDLFPEFDVPDFSELPGDESYDADLTTELVVDAMRLVSPWRREVDQEAAREAVRAVRASQAFSRAKASTPTRSPHLGDLEAVAWMPPCESGQPRWTIDVWWLTAFDGRVGKGWSFLVDNDPATSASERILAQREFTVRTA
jgi:hypothetical protein